MKTYSQLFNELDSYSKRFLESQLNKWQKEQALQYENFSVVFKKVIEKINRYDGHDTSFFWKDLEQSFKDLNKWITTILSDAKDIELTFADWHEQTQHFFSSFPETIEEEIKDDFWLKEGHDSFFIKMWKFYSRRKNGLKNFGHGSKNALRKIFRKPQAVKLPLKKTIRTNDFFYYYFTLPFLSSIYEIWQNHLQHLREHLAEIHKETEQIVHPLFADGNFDLLIKPDKRPLIKLVKKLDGFETLILDFNERYNVFKKGTLSSNKQFLSHLKDQIDRRWKFAGSFILPARKFSIRRFQKDYSKFEKQYRESNSDWQKHLDGEKSDWQKDNELSIIQLYAGHLCQKTIALLKKKLDSLLPAFIEPRRMIENTIRDMKATRFETADIFREKIMTISRTVLRDLHREKLPQLADVIVNTQIIKTMESYPSQMENELENLSEEYTVFRYQDLDGIPPASKFIDIPLKDIITEEIFSNIESSHKPALTKLGNTIDMLIRSVSENDQIIELNFDTALELLESDEENALNKAINVATEGLERAEKQLSDLIDQSNENINASIERLIDETLSFEGQVQDLSDNNKIIALKIRAEKVKTQDRIRERSSTIWQRIKRSLPGLLNLLAESFKKLQIVYYRLRKITGFAEISADVEDQLSQFLYHINKQLKRLPYVYQRLFRFQPLDDYRFFSARDDEMEVLKSQLEHWKKGNFAITALIGEKGSGRTTILNFAEKEFYSNINLVKINLNETTYKEQELFTIIRDAFQLKTSRNFEDLEQELQKRETGFACIFENMHNMFLRIPEGFEAIERFLLFISNTHQKIHWIITCGVYSWYYLDRVLNIHNFFHKSIFLPQLSQESIKQLILKRHRVSGYKLHFDVPERLAENRKFKKLTSEQEKQDFLNEMYFDKLSEHSAGNITVAFLFWLSSIREIKEDYLIIYPDIEFEGLAMKNMAGDDLFTFAAFLQHETLTPAQHALIFNQDLQKSLLLFNRMKNKGILAESTKGYQVHYLLYRPVVRALKINNLLL